MNFITDAYSSLFITKPTNAFFSIRRIELEEFERHDKTLIYNRQHLQR